MQTPKTRAGFLTEKIMSKVKAVISDINTAEYNQIYTDVLHVLQEALPSHSDIPPQLDKRLLKKRE